MKKQKDARQVNSPARGMTGNDEEIKPTTRPCNLFQIVFFFFTVPVAPRGSSEGIGNGNRWATSTPL
jgi:hypothetical protein